MNNLQRGIITLLKSAVTEQAFLLPEGFDMEAACPAIKRHHIIALAYDGAVRCGIPVKTPVMQKLFQGSWKSLVISQRQMKQIGRIYEAFDENGIDYMPLKGCRMKVLYPKSELRVMADADILIRMEQYDRIRPILKELGFQEKDDSDHELIWQNDALYLELHKRLIPSYNQDFYAYFGDGWRLAKEKKGTRYAMTAEDEWIFLFTHFSKHFRDGGIGCRHVVDLWVYLRSHPHLNEAYVAAEMKKLQLFDFYENIRQLLAFWFENAQPDDKTELISEYIFASGSWGTMESRVLSRVVRDSKHALLGFNGKLLYLWQTAFPSAQHLKGEYTVLKKAPYLLPAVWLIRLFCKVLFERGNLKRHERNMEALNEDSMKTRRQLLNYMGLDYRF